MCLNDPLYNLNAGPAKSYHESHLILLKYNQRYTHLEILTLYSPTSRLEICIVTIIFILYQQDGKELRYKYVSLVKQVHLADLYGNLLGAGLKITFKTSFRVERSIEG